MQRYGDLGLNTNIRLFSSFVCCDRHADLRQKKGIGLLFCREGWRMERSLDYARDDSGDGDDMQSISLLVRRSRRCGRAGGR